MNRKLLFLSAIFCFCLSSSLAQDVSEMSTKFSRLENGTVGAENYSFKVSSGTVIIRDLDNGREDKYGPVILQTSGYGADGYYFEAFISDIANSRSPRKFNYEVRVYKFLYETKNGKALGIIEVRTAVGSEATQKKVYYTTRGKVLLS